MLSKKFMDLKQTYDHIAEDWVKDHANDVWWRDGCEEFVRRVKSGGTVLDLGCAGGMKSKFLSEKGFAVTGVDISEKMIEIAKREVSGVEFFCLDLRDIGSLQKKFDGIFCQAVFLHLRKNEVVDTLLRLKHFLYSGGILYVAVKEQRPGQAEEAVLKENDYGYEYERFFSYYNMKELHDFFVSAGFEIVSEDRVSAGKTTWLEIVGRK